MITKETEGDLPKSRVPHNRLNKSARFFLGLCLGSRYWLENQQKQTKFTE